MADEEYAHEHSRPYNAESDIFVFGANEEGHHYSGAARYAAQHCGAEAGVSVGPTGSAYAIPVTQGLSRLREEIDRFIDYAVEHPGESFFVTRVGCYLANYQDNGIAPLFLRAPDNCLLPLGWRDLAILRQGLEPEPKVY